MEGLMMRWLAFGAIGVSVLMSSSAMSQQTAPVPFNPAVTFEPFHANGIYRKGERVGWTLRAPLGMGPQRFSYTIRQNNFSEIKSGTIDLAGGVGTIETMLNEPGMIYVRLTPIAATPVPPATPATGDALAAPPLTAAELDRLTVAAAVAPMELSPSAPRPVDFDAFWAAKLALLKQVPINPVLAPAPTAQAGVELSTVTLDSVGSRVHGYIAKPDRAGKFPALVIFQYAGVYPLVPETATARAAEGWLAFNVDSHDMAPTEATAPRDYAQIGANDRETSYFLKMYLRDTRALDYIASRPDWDGKTIVLMGTSMGGQQSLVTAGLNPGRVTAVIINVASGADSNGELHRRKAGYPYWKVSDPAVAQTALYFDTVNFASKIRAPTLAAMGFLDTTSPPVGIFTALAQIPGAKEPVPMVESDHNHITPQKEERFYRRSRQVLDTLVKGGTFVPDRNWAQAR
jgi:cephalosporin-C deacetylase